jgi:hypothetical protein
MRWLALAALLVLTGCSTYSPGVDPDLDASLDADAPVPTSSIFTLTPLPTPPQPPPSGQLVADLRQSSRDGALDRFEVWIDNDTAASVTPTAVTYVDGRYRTPLPGSRLREIPSQSERGFPIHQPDRPACGAAAGTPTLTVSYAGSEVTIPVADDTDVAGRYADSRCLELAVDRVARLSWSDEVPSSGEPGAVGTLTLQVRPTGRPGPTLTIDSIRGTPVLNSAEGDWTPGLTVTGTSDPVDLPLPLKPTRCDAHAFSESGGATAFALNVHLDGKPGQLILRMSTAGAAHAIEFGKDSCGSLTSISSG